MRAAETLPQLIAEEVGGMQLQQKLCQSSFLILACSCGGGAATAHCWISNILACSCGGDAATAHCRKGEWHALFLSVGVEVGVCTGLFLCLLCAPHVQKEERCNVRDGMTGHVRPIIWLQPPFSSTSLPSNQKPQFFPGLISRYHLPLRIIYFLFASFYHRFRDHTI